MKFKSIILASTLTLSMIPFSSTQYASASEMSNVSNPSNQELFSNTVESNINDVEISKLNNSTLQIDIINKNVDIEFNENGEVILTNNEKSEVLPSFAIDENNQNVRLVYKQNEDGLIVEVHKIEAMFYASAKSPSKWQCALGTLGGYYTGAVVGGTAGAGAGAVAGAGVGAIPGGIGGAIAGAIGGALTGAAEYCFK